MKKILIVCQHFWPESFRINDIAEYLNEEGFEIDVLCGQPNYPTGKFAEGHSHIKPLRQNYKGINIIRCAEIPRGNNSNLRILINYLVYPITSLLSLPRIMNNKYDKIFIYQLSPVMMGIAGIVLGKIKKIETTMYVLDLWPENLFSVLDIRNKFLRKVLKEISCWHYKKVDKVISISEKMRSHLIENIGILEENIIFIPQVCEKFYEEEIVDSILQERFKEGFNIVFTGNISPAQSFETILEVARRLKEKGVIDINWIIVGDGMSRKWLEEEVRKLKLSNFYFEGFIPATEIPRYTTQADALIGCLTKTDLLDCTIPAKVFSYIAAGKPLILAMDGEVQEIVNSKAKCGFAVDAEDVDAIYQAVVELKNMSTEERSEMGKRAKVYHYEVLERNKNYANLIKFLDKSVKK